MSKMFNPYVFAGLHDEAQSNLRRNICYNTGELTIIANSVCDVCEISMNELKSSYRKHELNDARKIFFHIARRLYLFTNTKLGKYTGRDHSTVVIALQRCEDYLDTDPIFREQYVKALMATIKNLKQSGYHNYKHTYKEVIKMSEVYMSNEIDKYESRSYIDVRSRAS